MIFRRQGTYGLVALLVALFASALLSDSAWAQTLNVTKADSPDPVQVGENLTYTINVSSTGGNATGVQLVDTLPANTTFVSAQITAGGDPGDACDAAPVGNVITCDLGTVQTGSPEQVTIVVKPTDAAGVAEQVSNTVTADGSNTAPASARQTTQVQPQVSITKNDRPNAVEVGDFIVYTLTVTNNTGSNQTVRIRDVLPDEVDFEDVAPDPPTCRESAQNSNVVRCDDILLTPGESETVQIVVQAEEEGTARNTAEVRIGNTLIDQATVETDIEGNNPGPNPPPPPIPDDPDDDFFDDDDDDGIPNGFDDDFNDDFFTQEAQYEDANDDLDDEVTDGEDTFGDDFDDGDDDGPAVSAEAGDGVAEASTPNAVARAGDDPDELTPIEEPLGDVEDEIPTSGPLPNTGGMPLVYWLLPLAGLLMLAGLPVYRWAKRRE